jgi:predicted short-subunit dehydrogenase-like oxidoreductase (DUF2520 family)
MCYYMTFAIAKNCIQQMKLISSQTGAVSEQLTAAWRLALLARRRGDNMKIGIIGSGRVGYSMGKYLSVGGEDVVGYYDRHPKRAADAASFTQTKSFTDLSQLVELSDTLFITTQDGEIANIWDCISQYDLKNKIISHFSGSLSSDVFQGIDETGAKGLSIHPMLAFSDKYNSYLQLNEAFFTLEGNDDAVRTMSEILAAHGNHVLHVSKEDKALYHCATSVLSNHVVAVLQSGYEMLEAAGFSTEDAIRSTANLVKCNVENVIANGPVNALTGPIERNDVGTVQKHLSSLNDAQKARYCNLGMKIVEIAMEKHPEKDYEDMISLLQ